MQTITLNGRELPIDGLEGCPDFQLDSYVEHGYLVEVTYFNTIETSFLSDSQLRHAACVAARWFERLSKTVYPFAADEYWHTIPNPKCDEYRDAARAWGALADELWEV